MKIKLLNGRNITEIAIPIKDNIRKTLRMDKGFEFSIDALKINCEAIKITKYGSIIMVSSNEIIFPRILNTLDTAN